MKNSFQFLHVYVQNIQNGFAKILDKVEKIKNKRGLTNFGFNKKKFFLKFRHILLKLSPFFIFLNRSCLPTPVFIFSTFFQISGTKFYAFWTLICIHSNPKWIKNVIFLSITSPWCIFSLYSEIFHCISVWYEKLKVYLEDRQL